MYYNDWKEKIIYVKNTSENGFLDVLMAGVTYPNPNYRITKHSDPFHVFEYVVSGSGTINYKGEKKRVTAGDFYYISNGISPYYFADKNEPYEKIWVNVKGSLIDKLTELYKFEPVFSRQLNVRGSFLEIHDILERMTVENMPQLTKSLSKCFFELISDIGHSNLFNESQSEQRSVMFMRNYIDNNIYKDISLDVMAEQFHVKKMHIIRIFKREFDVTPMQYVIQKRVSIAKTLLVETSMPIKEISSLLRYSNTQHFSNTYRRATGMTPNCQRSIARCTDKTEG